MTKHILIVEDETKLTMLLRDYLTQNGYSSDWAEDGEKAVQLARSNNPDLILLDLMLPKKDGLDVCKDVRAFSDIPIIMLTARVDEVDRLIGLELGADDYICKPYSPREVIARIKAIFRRIAIQAEKNTPQTQDKLQPNHSDINISCSEGNQEPNKNLADLEYLEYRGITIIKSRFQCLVNHIAIDLTPVEMRILTLLIKHPGRVFSRDNIIAAAYDDHRIVSGRTIDSHIKNLRKKLDEQSAHKDLIRSIYGIGYKLE